MDDFEDWEVDYELNEKMDWSGLVEWRKSKYDKNPTDHYNQYYYCEALIKNGEYPKAIKILASAHLHYPDSSDISLTLLDALFKNGQTEKDFNWEIDPCILYLDEKTEKYCAKYLKYRKKNRTILDIYVDLMMYECYLKFSEIELFNYLKESERFMVLEDKANNYHEIEFRNKRK